MDKRISSLHRSITGIRSTLEKAATEYAFKSIEKEFPHSGDYRDIMYVGKNIPTASRMLSDLIQRCIIASDFAVDENEQSFVKYARLVNTASVLRDSRFLSQLISDSNRVNWERIQDAVKLKRRLGKVCHYTRIRQLIEKVQQLPSIPFEWVEESFSGTGEGEFEFCIDPMEVVGRVLNRQLTSKEIDEVAARFPSLPNNWGATLLSTHSRRTSHYSPPQPIISIRKFRAASTPRLGTATHWLQQTQLPVLYSVDRRVQWPH
jgi:hypothetical protein